MGLKCSRNYFFCFPCYLSYIWVDLILLASLIFPLSFWWKAWAFWGQGLLKSTILSTIIYLPKKVQQFSRNTSKNDSVSESLWSRILETSLKLSKILVIKHNKEIFLRTHFLRKVFLFLFWFFLTKFYDLNRIN